MIIRHVFLYVAVACIALLLLSGCDVYQTLYAKPQPANDLTFVPLEDIKAEEGSLLSGSVQIEAEGGKVTVELADIPQGEAYQKVAVWFINSAEGAAKKVALLEPIDGKAVATGELRPELLSITDRITVNIYGEEDTFSEEAVVLEGRITERADVMVIRLDQLKAAEKKGEGEPAAMEEEGIEPEQEESANEEGGAQEALPVTDSDAKVIIAEETSLVRLSPKVADPDGDEVTILYSSPLDADGEWQTTYGDAGQYTVTLTVSDGELSTTQDVLIIINKKEEAPAINAAEPEGTTLSTEENKAIAFSVSASDLNNDELIITWKVDGSSVQTGSSFTYTPSFDDAGSHTIKVIVTDQSSEASQLWAVDVANINRLPAIKNIAKITVRETETVTLSPEADDPDNDPLEFTISEPVGDDGSWETTYDDAGQYTVTVTVSDGENRVEQLVEIEVVNVNRPPVIEDITSG
ncbi:TPA: hypothetical protein HA361_04315 [Candidatus Woesearchaeota archaeon]|nr:hypothetical protein [Candidatus Woesearchaeota archaeon]HII68644.1 hypothetical protein [Candidatus Woesearchaeota archaeon]